jgi:hypothetical protein
MRCAICKRETLADEPVYRLRRGHDGSRTAWRDMFGDRAIVTACARCRENPPPSDRTGVGSLFTFAGFDREHWLPPKPCSHCGRPVIVDQYRGSQRYIVCGDQCRIAIYNANARKKYERRQLPERCCAVCDRPFAPRRSDALYCSAACKQKEYRRRLIAVPPVGWLRGARVAPRGLDSWQGTGMPAGTGIECPRASTSSSP